MTLVSEWKVQSLPKRERLYLFRLDISVTRLFLLLVGVSLVACQIVDVTFSFYANIACILILGMPHGALDAELARSHLQPRWKNWWFVAFALPYLSLSALVLLAWHMCPLLTLGLFLALSVWHFGEGHGHGVRDVIVTGGAPVALPVLLHPSSTAVLLGIIARVPVSEIPQWLLIPSLIWLAFTVFFLASALRAKKHVRLVGELGFVTLLYALLSPLTALTIYFVCLHAPSHIQDLIRDKSKAPRIRSVQAAIVYSLPATLLTYVLGFLLWPLYNGPLPQSLLCLTIQGLAALTLPHMLLNAYLSRRKINSSAVFRTDFPLA